MSRLIDVDALWEELGVLYHQNNGKVNWNDALMEIKTAPTIETETEEEAYERGYTAGQMAYRKTGKWLPDNNNYITPHFVCSACGVPQKVETVMYSPIWTFCPRCGADMRGEQE